MATNQDMLYATVVLKSMTDKNSINSPNLTSVNINEAFANNTTILGATTEFKKLGFEINNINNLTLSIAGKKELYEKCFKAIIEERIINNNCYYKFKKKVIPAPLKTFIVDIVFAEPIELF